MREEEIAERLIELARKHGGTGEYVRWAKESFWGGDYARAIYWARAELHTYLGVQVTRDLIAAAGATK